METDTRDIHAETRNLAFNRVGRKETSTSDLASYLKRKGASQESIGPVIDYLCSLDIVNDARYARLRSRALFQSGKGFIYARQDLRRHGIKIEPEQFLEWTEQDTGITEVDVARQLVARKYANAHEDPKYYRRALGGLLRRGYSFATAKDALDHLKRGAQDEESN